VGMRRLRRKTGYAPSKEAKNATSYPPPVGGDYALLPGDLPLLATDYRL
jgi:hypothetical protein